MTFASCNNNKQGSEVTSGKESKDTLFNTFKDKFVNDLWEMYPDWATGVGNHRYDSVLMIPNEENRKAKIAFSKRYLDSLSSYKDKHLDENNKTDKALIANFLESSIWGLEKFKSYEWDPSNYNIGGTVSEILNNKKETLSNKVAAAVKKVSKLDEYYNAAKANINAPTKEHTELAIQQLKGTMGFFGSSLIDSINKIGDAQQKEKYIADVKKGTDAINGYISFLEDLLKNNKATKDFRIGKGMYDEKFKYDIQSSYSASQIYQIALQRKDELHKEMSVLAKKLWPKYMKGKTYPGQDKVAIKELISEIAKTHVRRDKFQSEIERQIPILTKFVKEKDLLYLDPSKPLVVRKEPEWMAGVAGASISSPGPYDKEGDTFYNVGSLAGYTPEGAESYLKEYNKYILQILNIHEAIPGHYAQLVYSNQSPSIIKSILGNGAMVEGWAVYTERMMMEEGWDKNTEINGQVEQDEMWLMYSKWHLRVVCNTILDYSVHNLNWDKEQVLDLLINEAFQEKAEAEGKWRRATLTQVQLCSYFTGYTEIYNFREELKKKQGDKFNLKQFHEKFLSYGSAPVSEIRRLMLAEID